MKYKNIIYIGTLSSIVSMSSCFDMNITPTDRASESNVWQSAILSEQAVTGVYNHLYEEYKDGNSGGWLDMWSSVMDIDANWTSSYNFLHATNSPSSDKGSLLQWRRAYKGILRANDVICNLPSVPDLEEAKKSRLISECKFLRSWWYYRINILYNGVPYYENPIKNIDEAKMARSTQNEIWNYLIEDLTECVNDENLPLKYSAGDSNYGRVTKGAVYALRGKIYMWMKEWQKAADDFQSVKDCGYSLFTSEGSESYKQLFKEKNEQCDEMIFSLQCIEEDDFATKKNKHFGNRCCPPTVNGLGLGWNNYIINPNFVDSYELKNGKKFNWDDIIPEYNSMPVNARMVYFLRNDLNSQERENMESQGADMSKYDATNNEERIKKAYENRDPRMNFSVIVPYSSFNGGVEGYPKDYVMRFPFRSYNGTNNDLKSDTSAKFYYLNRKFVGEGLENPYFYSSLDQPLIRYADVLLNWAEALNELNDLPGAISKVNEVRRRAGIQELGTNEYTQVSGKNDMHERIMNERHWELIGEDVIYFDEIRWGTWKDLKFGTDNQGITNGLRQIWGTPTYSYKWGGDHYWSLPIPYREIQMNPNMKQNPGW